MTSGLTTPDFVAIRGVTRRFGDVVAVDHANLDVPKGSLVALLGPSGCGKTTLLRLIGGLDQPDAGSIAVDGQVLTAPGTFVPPERRRVVMVFQDFALFPHLNVARNVAFGLPRGQDRAGRLAQLLALVGLDALGERMPHELSGGQQQRVALARALAAEPRLILLDEPFSNLDPSVRQRLRLEVRALIREVGITAVFVTHDQEEALSLADQVAVMDAGRILQTGTPREIYDEPATLTVAEFVGHPNILPGEVRAGSARCALGALSVAGAITDVDGPAAVMVRSEQLRRTDGEGVPAEVVEVHFLGHEQVVELRLAGGELLRARWSTTPAVLPGDRAFVAVAGPVRAFPRA